MEVKGQPSTIAFSTGSSPMKDSVQLMGFSLVEGFEGRIGKDGRIDLCQIGWITWF